MLGEGGIRDLGETREGRALHAFRPISPFARRIETARYEQWFQVPTCKEISLQKEILGFSWKNARKSNLQGNGKEI